MMDRQFDMVKEFQEAMEQPVADYPKAMDWKRREIRADFIKEEIEEFLQSSNLVDQVDGIIDAIYLLLGTLVEIGVRPGTPFEIVHKANMSKLWEDGKPRFREGDGKVIKPPHFVKPEPKLQKEINDQKTIASFYKFAIENKEELWERVTKKVNLES